MPIVVALTNNITMLLALIFLYGLIRPHIQRQRRLVRDVLRGFIYGICALSLMLVPFQLSPGIMIDGRSVMLGIAALFSGAIPGLISGIIVALYRLSLGGVGAPLGVGSVATTIAFGLLLRYFLVRRGYTISLLWLLVMGILVVLSAIFWISMIPSGPQLLETAALPIVILYPMGVILAGSLVQYMERREKLAEALRISEQRYRALLNSAPDALIIINPAGVITYVNDRVEAIFGYRHDELLGKPIESLIPEAQRDQHVVHRADYTANPRVREMGAGLELHALRKDGNPFSVEVALSPINTETEKLVLCAVRDVTARKQIERDLAAERNLLRTLIDSIPDYIYVKDTQGRFIMANNAIMKAGDLADYDDIIGKTDFDFYPPDLAQAFRADEQQIIESGHPLVGKEEESIDLNTGQETWFSTTKVPLRDGEGTITSLVGISRNITESKQAEEKLYQERNLLRALIDSTPDYIFIKDAEGRFIISNTAHAQAAHTTPKELIGKTAFDAFPTDLAANFHADDARVMQSGEPLINVERTTTDEGGNVRIVLTTKIPLRDKKGQVSGLVGISRDITIRKQLEDRNVDLAVERRRIDVLQRFINDMSHDFRTPLTVIGSGLELIQRLTDPQKIQGKIKLMEQQVLRLDKLLNELLEMEQLDQETINLQLEATDINVFLVSIVQEYEIVATAKHITIRFAPELDSCMVRLDPVEFTRAVVHLLENAMTYTAEGGSITVRTAIEDDQVVIAIHDTGIGIAASDLTHIFERFYRVDQARSTDTGGHGLGLPIARSIIEAHHGSITVESTPSQGSTFSIHLPMSE